ncbi:winged helix-turn-helix transcriptional regulator, partial [Pseudomonas viridiflava]|uniref:winged helix-turn-helix transcriptional regulator n=2 Tax=Pseudomonas TaxID=286 RepID=UPI001F154DE9
LKEMEEKGVVVRTVLATSPPSAEYSLSELGLELLPAIEAIAKIGYRLRLKLEQDLNMERE